MKCVVLWRFITAKGPLAPGLNFVKNSVTCFYSLFISSSALNLIAERLASVTADTSFKVFGSELYTDKLFDCFAHWQNFKSSKFDIILLMRDLLTFKYFQHIQSKLRGFVM